MNEIEMLAWFDSVPISIILLLCATLGLAPFTPEPHLVEKLRMLVQGNLVRPLDMLDLLMHGAPFLALGFKLLRLATKS